MSGIRDSLREDGMDDVVAAVRELQKVIDQAKALGIFAEDRELLECPTCGLMEDVTVEGVLVTYREGGADMTDCGLRFSPVDDIRWQCPSCGTGIEAVIS